jgi:hypothetical protein
MFPLEYRIWDGSQMLVASNLSFEEQFVEAVCPIRKEKIRYAISSIQLMPYTGCIDSHNQKIYLSDIVQVTPMLVETIPTFKAIVIWDKYRFALRTLDDDGKHSLFFPYNNLDPFGLHLTVIGDMYRNPEWMK